MNLYLTFEVSDFSLAQKIISAVGALGVKPTDMKYSLPTAAKRAVELVEPTTDEPRPLDEIDTEPEPAVYRPNVSPGEPSIGKIGGETKARLLGSMQDHDMSPDYDGGKWREHMKLLWKRGEVKFDGSVFYAP